MSTILSTPSKNRTSARSLSHNTENTPVSVFKEDLAVDVRRAQDCDFNSLLKYKLSCILDAGCKEKKELDSYQNSIEELERKLDDEERRAEATKQGNLQDDMDQDEGEGSGQSNLEIAQWKDKLDQLKTDRQIILDRLLDECLEKVLPISKDAELHRHLTEYSKAQRETDLYSPFVKACNVALDRMDKLAPDMFRPTSSLNCRFHRNDPLHIKSFYLENGSEVSIKPDVIITSTVAAEDVKSQPNELGEKPKENFEWRQTLCCTEFKRSGSPLTLNPPLGEAAEPPVKRAKVDVSEPTAGTSAAGSTSKTSRGSGSKARASTSRGSKSRGSKSRGSTSRGSKTTGSFQTMSNSKTEDPPNDSKATDPETQCAMYAMEMLSYAIGVHHAITLLISDYKLWVWYYDRQGVIRSTDIDFVLELPRFLVLLFAFQRYNLTNWGVITELNPGAVLAHDKFPATTDSNKNTHIAQAPHDARLERKKVPQNCLMKTEILDTALGLHRANLKEINIDLGNWLSHKPHSLAGRATAVVAASDPEKPTQGKLACKISFPEVAREGEGTIIEEIRVEIEGDSKKKHLVKHLPQVLVFGDMSRYGTQRVRSMLQISIRGYRTLRVLISRKLAPLTDLKGEQFVKAWLEVVRFHAFLWTIGVEHGDPSLWNVMYNEDLECGVLGDYDLSISRRRPRVFGTERTGTIPFMAVQLLTPEYWAGKIERLYRHELEAFMWMLPFVFLRYQDKKSRKGTPVDSWMTSDYITCFEKKNAFWWPDKFRAWKTHCQSDFKDLWLLAYHLLDWWRDLLILIGRTADMRAFDQDQGKSNFDEDEDDNSVASMWPKFIIQLKRVAKRFSGELGFIEGIIQELDLETV